MRNDEFDNFGRDMARTARLLIMVLAPIFIAWVLIGGYKASTIQAQMMEEYEKDWNALIESEKGTLIDDHTYVVESDSVSVNSIKDSHNTYYKIYDVWLEDSNSILTYSQYRIHEMEIHKSNSRKSYMKTKTTYKKNDSMIMINSESIGMFYLNDDDIKEITGD